MKNKFLLAVGSVALLLAVGCTKKPGKVGTAFMEDFAAGKSEEVVKMSGPALKAFGEDKLKAGVAEASAKLQKEGKTIKNIEVAKEEITGDTATVTLKVVYSNDKEENVNMNLVKIDGKWLVNNLK